MQTEMLPTWGVRRVRVTSWQPVQENITYSRHQSPI